MARSKENERITKAFTAEKKGRVHPLGEESGGSRPWTGPRRAFRKPVTLLDLGAGETGVFSL